MKQITFIHAADLHLDSPMIGLSHLPKEMFERLKESTFVALKKLVDEAINHQVILLFLRVIYLMNRIAVYVHK